MRKHHVLDLGCGVKKHDGAIGLDISTNSHANIIWNLEETPLPFEDASFDVIIAENIIEHLNNIIPLMKDLHRILKPNGIIKIIVPHFTWNLYYQDLTHHRPFSIFSFDFFSRTGESKSCSNYFLDFEFDTIERKVDFCKWWSFLSPVFNRFPRVWEFSFLKNLFPACSIHITLKKKIQKITGI